MYIDATNLILGRLASTVAKKLLSGESVFVLNAEKAVITGNPDTTINGYKAKRSRGDPYHGPFFPSDAEKIVKRTVRGMLPYKTPRGKEALKRLKVFISIPNDMQGKELISLKEAENRGEEKFITLQRLTELI